MAKDPKNFTGENMNALLNEAASHEQARTEWKGIAMLSVVAAWVVVAVIGIFTLFR
ncbi:hypothetical protein NU688_33730 [Variovorax sp. ZS18.2.2]|uniref:hypothetical protein n=1 Tax=Variovorax sp. ZS18.2.2 TaxID=2971255 RepID=UPI00215165E1|nr:hypothetical protein [Variovorax sp. ZS18.2.2]MCR6481160.1 hypothetical protein [Variovorax sp. ZS18.2.2]